MAIAGVLVKIVTTFLPLIKEYITSGDKRKDILSLHTMSIWVIISLMVGTLCSLYLAEQATANLTLHEPLIKQYQKLTQENAKLKAEQILFKSTLSACREEVGVALSICTANPTKSEPPSEIVYDKKTQTMVFAKDLKN